MTRRTQRRAKAKAKKASEVFQKSMAEDASLQIIWLSFRVKGP